MIEAWCENCGAHFSVDDSLAGKRVRCARCKAKLTLPEANPFLPDEPSVDIYNAAEIDDQPLEAEAFIEDENGETPAVMLDMAKSEDFYENINAPKMAFDDDKRSFIKQISSAFGFALKPSNLASTIGISFLIFLMSFFPLFGPYACVGYPFLLGVWFFLQFCIVSGTCNNEDNLITIFTDFELADIIKSLFSMIAVIALAFAPSSITIITLYHVLDPTTYEKFALIINICSYISAMLIFPMMMLVMVLYGLDLPMLWYYNIIKLIYRSFGKYVPTCIIISICYLGSLVIYIPLPQNIALFLLLKITCSFMFVYLTYTAMRVLGVFYRCTKGKLQI